MKKVKSFTSIIALAALFVFALTGLAHAGSTQDKIRNLIGQWIQKQNVGPGTGPAEILWLITPSGSNEILLEQSQCVRNCQGMSLGKFYVRLKFTSDASLNGTATQRTVPTPQVRRCSSNPTFNINNLRGFVSSDNRTLIIKVPSHRWYNTHICRFADGGAYTLTLSKK